MNAMILGAGRGTRLGALGEATAKVLVDVGGAPLLARQLDVLAGLGIHRAVVNAHHLAEQVQAFVDRYRGPLELRCIVEERLLGTAGGVRNALPLLEPGPFLVVYGDVVVEEPLAPMLETHRRADSLATLAVHEAESAIGKGVVSVDDAGRVTGFAEKAAGTVDAPVLVNSGVYVLETELVAAIPQGTVSDFGHEVFPSALSRGLRLAAHRLARPVIDVGTPEGLDLARARAGR